MGSHFLAREVMDHETLYGGTPDDQAPPALPPAVADAAPPEIDPDVASYVAEVQEEVDALDVPADLAATDRQRFLLRVLRRRGQLEAEIERVREATAALLRGLESKLRALDWVYGTPAADITRELLGRGKARSIKTPFGTAGFRRQPALLVVEDAEAVIAAWERKELPAEAVKVKVSHSPVKAELDRLWEAGEVPPGCSVREAGDRFYMK